MIYGIMFLYPKEGWIIIISTELQKTEPTYDKEQDTTALNWRSNQQVQRCQVL